MRMITIELEKVEVETVGVGDFEIVGVKTGLVDVDLGVSVNVSVDIYSQVLGALPGMVAAVFVAVAVAFQCWVCISLEVEIGNVEVVETQGGGDSKFVWKSVAVVMAERSCEHNAVFAETYRDFCCTVNPQIVVMFLKKA